jgi:FixJ family two-component response regulator
VSEGVIHLVDDEPAVRVALGRLLRLRGHATREHDSAEAFLADVQAADAVCIIADLRMPGFSGLELQAELQRRGIEVPLIFLTGHGDVASSVTAMKGGAVDFLQKPVRDEELFRAVDEALSRAESAGGRRSARAAALDRLATLTAREREVLALVVAGRRNRQIGAVLGISEQTAKVHRMRGMAKLQLETVPDLVRLWGETGLEQPPSPPEREDPLLG